VTADSAIAGAVRRVPFPGGRSPAGDGILHAECSVRWNTYGLGCYSKSRRCFFNEPDSSGGRYAVSPRSYQGGTIRVTATRKYGAGGADGKLATAVLYPDATIPYTYSYDQMDQLVGMTGPMLNDPETMTEDGRNVDRRVLSMQRSTFATMNRPARQLTYDCRGF
jgi:hypothetical protein